MNKFHPQVILCPTDYSELATHALRYARAVAACFHARMIVLHAEFFEAPAYFTTDQATELLKSVKRSRKAAEAHLRKYAQGQLHEFGDLETLVVDQRAVPAILSTAQNKKADLIVMGTQGRGGLGRLMLGSVAERIVHETDRPVLTVRRKKGEGKPEGVSIKKILCPVNYTEVAHWALEHAVAVAECFQADLDVLHVIETSIQDETEQKAREKLCTWVPEEMRPRCQLSETIRKGDAGEQIIDSARVLDSDLIVIGAQHKRFSDTTVIGTTTTRVTHHAPCPVLIVMTS